MHTENIDLTLIDPPLEDDRLERDPADIAALADDISIVGLIHPVTLEARDGRYECVAGWTRVLACRALHWLAIPAQVHEGLTPASRARIRLAENLQRSNLSPIEEAIRLAHLQAGEQLGIDQLAELVHRSPEWVTQRLNLLTITDDLQAYVHTRELAIASALALARVTDPQHRAHLLQYALGGGATVESVRAWVREWELHRSSGLAADGVPPPLPAVNQPHQVLMPCARCHQSHDAAQSTVIRVCPACGRELEAEMRELRTAPRHT